MPDRYASPPPPTSFSSARPAIEDLRRRAAGLALPSGPRAAERHPGIRILPPNPARHDLEALSRCFCAIYASSEHAQDGEAIWGEGWRCRWCGTEHGVDVAGPCASCGAEDQEALNDLEEIRRKLGQVLKPRPDWHPVACVLEREGLTVGFAFGAVTTPRRAVAYLGEKLLEYTAELEACEVDLSRIDLSVALPATSPVFYMDELCIEPGARNGLASLQGLLSVLLAGASGLGARGLMGFTSRRGAPFPFITPGGGEIAIDLRDLVVFRSDDFLPLATLCHHLSPEALAGVLARTTRESLEGTAPPLPASTGSDRSL